MVLDARSLDDLCSQLQARKSFQTSGITVMLNVELVHTKSLPLYISYYDCSFTKLNFAVALSYVK